MHPSLHYLPIAQCIGTCHLVTDPSTGEPEHEPLDWLLPGPQSGRLVPGSGRRWTLRVTRSLQEPEGYSVSLQMKAAVSADSESDQRDVPGPGAHSTPVAISSSRQPPPSCRRGFQVARSQIASSADLACVTNTAARSLPVAGQVYYSADSPEEVQDHESRGS